MSNSGELDNAVQLMSLNSGIWDQTSNLSQFGSTGDWWTTWCQPIHYYYPSPHTQTIYVDRKIRLKLSEVDTLHKACKDNENLKNVLKKITPMIEVEIDL